MLYVLILFSAVVESFGIASLYPVMDMLLDKGQSAVYSKVFFSWVPFLENYVGGDSFTLFVLITVGILFIAKNAFLILTHYLSISITTQLHCSWMDKIFSFYLSQPYRFFTEKQAGDLVQRQLVQTEKAATALWQVMLFMSGITLITALYLMMLAFAFKAVLLITLFIIPIYYFTFSVSRGPIYHSGDRIAEMHKRGYALSAEALSGVREVKTFGAEKFFSKRLVQIWEEFRRHTIRNTTFSYLPRPFLETFAALGGLIGIYWSLKMGTDIKNLMPLLAVFGGAFYRMLPLVSGASSQFLIVYGALPALEIVSALVKESNPVNGEETMPPMKKDIVFDQVSFAYNEGEPVLQDVSLRFEANRFYAIVGSSGSGKSTLMDLLLGFYTPDKGRVLVDGVDLKTQTPSSWLRQLGVISQDNFLFTGTVADNICFGLDERYRDSARILESSKMAHAWEFIQKMPEGFDTQVGERGVKLSGGQKQRLAIARALYRNPSVLIFDEATSSLDPVSEKNIQKAIEELQGKRTMIAVAHRLSTVVKADHIYVIANGRIVEQGTHQELREKKGVYHDLCEHQALH